MELIWLEDFVVLAEVGNFSRAAETRCVTQPAFSRRIRALEDWVGVALFERGPQGVTLTSVGEQIRAGAEDVVRRVHQLCNDAREVGRKEATTLHFAATHVLSFNFFPEWIRSLDPESRLGTIRLISDSMRACEQIMLQGEAQFLLCHEHEMAPSRFDPEQFLSLKVGQDSLALMCAPGEAGAPVWRLSQAKRIPYLGYSEESGLGRIVRASMPAAVAERLETVVTSRLAAALLTMVLSGKGTAWLPLSIAESDLQSGRLVRVQDPKYDITVGIRLFRPASRLSASAETFWARLKKAPGQKS